MDATPGPTTPGQDAGALRHLVDALVDQLAAGQVETLYGLHSAAAGVRQQAEALRAAAAEVLSARAELAEAQAALVEGRTALQELVDALRTDLVPEVVAQVQDQVSALVSAQVEAIGRATTETAAAVDEAGRILIDAFAGRVASFFSQLQQDLTKREARDTTRERALYERVQKLAEQGEARVKDLTDRLAHETAQLLSRDQELERQRAEAFVGVLETLLTKVGGRRQLRGRVRELVHTEHEVPRGAAVPATPVAPPAEPPQPAPVTKAPAAKKAAPAKKAPARKPVAVKAAPTKATATRAPAKKATARRKDDA